MSDILKDEIAKMAIQDLFGQGEGGQKLKETYEMTGRLHTPAQEKVSNSPSAVFTTMPDFKELAKVTGDSFKKAEILEKEAYEKKTKIFEKFETEVGAEARCELKKILRTIR